MTVCDVMIVHFVHSYSGASFCLQSQTEPDSLDQKITNSIFHAWQLCGDIHFLSTKLSESFSANLEDFQLENPEDAPIIALASRINESGSRKSCINE